MKKKLFSISVLLIIFCGTLNAGRSMYVDDFPNILGDIAAENALLTYAQSNQMETLLLYGLHIVHNTYDMTNPATNTILANFIHKAKTTYGILKVGATAENGNYFANVIDVYNNSRTDPLEKFDIYNLEYEYWNSGPTEPGGYYCTNYLIPNGLPCTNDGAFQFFISSLQDMRSLANTNVHDITTEAYVGWPTTAQAATIGANLDHLLLHVYLDDPEGAFSYAQNRIIDFANGTPNLAVSIIYSAEPNFMQNWLENNSMLAAETLFTTDWINSSSGWSNNIDLVGFTYFTYTHMANVILPVELVYFKGEAVDQDVVLSWKTLTETNSSCFEIERRDGNNDIFHTIGRKEAAGNSNTSLRYKFIDKPPRPGINYYRIKQIDFDGLFEYSDLVAVDYPDKFSATKIYPTVVKDLLFVQAQAKVSQISIYNANGNLVKVIEGANQKGTFKIELMDLIPGMYLLSLNFDSQVKNFQFIKQN